MTIQERVEAAVAASRDAESNRQFVRANGSYLRAYRNEAGLSQQIIADAAGVPLQYVSRIEHGVTKGIGAQALARLLLAFKTLTEVIDVRSDVSGGGS